MGLRVSHGPVCAVASSGHVLDGLPQVLLADDHQTSSLSRDILELVKHDALVLCTTDNNNTYVHVCIYA